MRYLSQASYALATVLVLILKKAPLLAISVFQHQPQEEAKGETVQPWFTGPLLAPSGTVIPTGHVNIQPYLFSQVITGYYNHHWQVDTIDNFYNNWFQLYTGIGLPNSLNITFAPQMIWNRTQGQNYAGFGDMPVALAYQLYFSQINSWVPSLKTAFEFNVPIGKYNKLNPRKKFTDALGAGSWLPTFKLVASGSKQFGNSIYFLNTRLAFAYIIGTKTFVKGLNSYGGGRKN
ncbi:MAG: hypothetical protein EBZ47_06280 [Chlamydiae bacterium]|nr:hypothetical protein [Chlamydiota bacterium]